VSDLSNRETGAEEEATG